MKNTHKGEMMKQSYGGFSAIYSQGVELRERKRGKKEDIC